MTRDETLRQQIAGSRREETDHLAWTQERIRALGGAKARSIRCGYREPLGLGCWPPASATRSAWACGETEGPGRRTPGQPPAVDLPAGRPLTHHCGAHEGRRRAPRAWARRRRCDLLPRCRWLMRGSGQGDDHHGAPYLISGFNQVEAGDDLGGFPSMMLASSISRGSGRWRAPRPWRGCPLPVTVKCMWILCEDLGIGAGAIGRDFDAAAANIVAPTAQDQHHIVGGAAAGARPAGFPWAGAGSPARRLVACIRAPSMGQNMAAAGFGHKPHAGTVPAAPVQFTVHSISPPSVVSAANVTATKPAGTCCNATDLRYTDGMCCPGRCADCLLHLPGGFHPGLTARGFFPWRLAS